MKKLLNFSTHPGEPEMFGDDWAEVASFLYSQQFDGFELYPVGNYPFEKIPARLIEAIHLRFFVFIREIWHEDTTGLLKLFDNWQNVEHFYGGRNREAMINAYVDQFNLAQRLGCSYVVFHPVHCDLNHVYDWKFPYHWRETLDLCSELLNESLKRSEYTGLLLFENLWWPGSFRLDDVREYWYLLERVNYDRCGIVLDTAHLLNAQGGFASEEEEVAYLLEKVESFGDLRQEIRTVHLTSSLSGEYITKTRDNSDNIPVYDDFWQRFDQARQHVSQIDPHLPFSQPAIGKLFDLVEPESVVFEFTFLGLNAWQEKIRIQKNALLHTLWK